MKNKEVAGWTVGLMIMFGFPAIAWAFFDWRWALVVFVIGQFLIGLLRLIADK